MSEGKPTLAERWIDSLHEDAHGLVWTTKAELRSLIRDADTAVVDAMNERARAVTLATWVLDDPSRDPDSDISILARQFLRCIGSADSRETPEPNLEREIGEALDSEAVAEFFGGGFESGEILWLKRYLAARLAPKPPSPGEAEQ